MDQVAYDHSQGRVTLWPEHGRSWYVLGFVEFTIGLLALIFALAALILALGFRVPYVPLVLAAVAIMLGVAFVAMLLELRYARIDVSIDGDQLLFHPSWFAGRPHSYPLDKISDLRVEAIPELLQTGHALRVLVFNQDGERKIPYPNWEFKDSDIEALFDVLRQQCPGVLAASPKPQQ